MFPQDGRKNDQSIRLGTAPVSDATITDYMEGGKFDSYRMFHSCISQWSEGGSVDGHLVDVGNWSALVAQNIVSGRSSAIRLNENDVLNWSIWHSFRIIWWMITCVQVAFQRSKGLPVLLYLSLLTDYPIQPLDSMEVGCIWLHGHYSTFGSEPLTCFHSVRRISWNGSVAGLSLVSNSGYLALD